MKALLLGSIETLAADPDLQRHVLDVALRAEDRPARDGGVRHDAAKQGGDLYLGVPGRGVVAKAMGRAAALPCRSERGRNHAVGRGDLVETIARIRAAGRQVGLVTTTTREIVERILSGLSLDRANFDVVITRADVLAPKPASDCYALAAGRLMVDPCDCLVVENDEDGIRAAEAAGMSCLPSRGQSAAGTGQVDRGRRTPIGIGATRLGAEPLLTD
jgi:beta-phosphoglucomutase-like phosphatase (HAD superfamily)